MKDTSVIMTCRDQLFRALSGEILDRPPAWLLFPYHPLGCYVDVQRHPAYRRVFEASKDRVVMLNRRTLQAPLHTAAVETVREDIDESGCRGQRIVMRSGSVTLRHEQLETARGTVKRPFIRSSEDLEAFLSLPVETDPVRLCAALERQMPQYLAEKDAFPERYGAMMLCLGEPIGALYGRCDLEEYAIASLTHAPLIEAWLDRMMERLRIIYRFCLERDLAEVYFLVGSEMASPPLLSRTTFQRWIVPYARELIAMIRGAERFAIQHYHGQIREILPDFLTMAPDGLHTIESPPIGDCTLEQAFDIVQNRITLIGNVQYDDFRALSCTEMARLVSTLVDTAAGRRFILSPTAGPFDPDVPDQVIRNYLTFIDTACPR